MTAGRSAASRRGLVVVFAVAFVSVAHGRVGAYRFFTEGDGRDREGRLIVGSEDAGRWSPDVLGPGETLVWEIAPDPEFEVFGGPQGVLPLVEQALAAWSDLPSAAISWRVSIGDEVDEAAKIDGRNTIFVNREGDFGGNADLWWERSSNGWEITECDVEFGKEQLAFAEDLLPEDLDPEDLEMRQQLFRARSRHVLVHEFGHCLGLSHAAALSAVGREVFPFGSRRLVHPLDPVMSYGWNFEREEAAFLAHDDVVGASLLWPADGWKRTTGSISGVLDLPGEEAARYAHVWALPVDGDPLRDRVGAFANRVGAFLIEGLRPGNYALWAQPIMVPSAHIWRVVPGTPFSIWKIRFWAAWSASGQGGRPRPWRFPSGAAAGAGLRPKPRRRPGIRTRGRRSTNGATPVPASASGENHPLPPTARCGSSVEIGVCVVNAGLRPG